MIGIKHYDGYSNCIRIYLSDNVELDMSSRTLILDHEKIKLSTLDRVEFSVRGNKNANQT